MLLDWRLWVFGGVLFAALAGYVWHENEVAAAYDKGYQQAKLEAQAAAARLSMKWQKEKDDAVREAERRRQAAAAAAAGARADAERLRDLLEDANRRLSNAAEQAVREYAIAANDVFNKCVREYQSLAEKADGHASDVRLMLDAWPKK